MIPGARGCTPQSCSFRDHFAELKGLGVDQLFGLSTQDTAYQQEAAERLHLPFAILSDQHLKLTDAMKLPTFETGGMTLLKRFTLVIKDGTVQHVFYPVFPPDRSASDVSGFCKDARSCGPTRDSPSAYSGCLKFRRRLWRTGRPLGRELELRRSLLAERHDHLVRQLPPNRRQQGAQNRSQSHVNRVSGRPLPPLRGNRFLPPETEGPKLL
jgi:peroxiredoxin